jgi:hypothetical protein
MRVEIEIHPDGLFVGDKQVNIPSLYEIPAFVINNESVYVWIDDENLTLDNGVRKEGYIERDILAFTIVGKIPDKLRAKILQELRDEILPLFPL